LTNDDPFDYLSNGTSNQVEEKNDIIGQDSQGVIVKWNIWSSWTNKKKILIQDS